MPTVTANGIQLAYESRGEGPPLLLISGVGYGGNFWRPFAALLVDAFRVITFDNRGAGASSKPPGPYTTRQLAADAAGLLDALGIEAAHVVGHSLGGMVAQELALGFAGRVRKLVLASTVGGPNHVPIPPDALELLTNRQGEPMELFRRGVQVATARGFAERHPEKVTELLQVKQASPVAPAEYAAQVAAGAGHDAETRLPNLTCPTLILTGGEDRVIPPENALLLAARIPGARVERVSGAGHLLFFERPEVLARLVKSFLVQA
ncbi:MAG TPA: alpha/beta hydrolase [Myxococcaceae bacterium]|nr:alpha/beta hydrolase [Myxococcaceae bacterium]